MPEASEPLFDHAGDSEGEEEGEEEETPSFQLSSSDKGLSTVGEAEVFVRELIEVQLAFAAELGAPPNQTVRGDSRARAAFRLLLPDPMQREVFLATAASPSAWQRLRPLFGAPPYHFLRPEDAGLLRAGGFAKHRTRMAYENANVAANVGQFAAQFVDDEKREYRVAPQRASSGDALPGHSYFSALGGNLVRMNVKIKKRSFRAKQQLYQAGQRRELTFPGVGERVHLTTTKALASATRNDDTQGTRMLIVALSARDRKAHTAVLLARAV